jgi:hypothetical protein
MWMMENGSFFLTPPRRVLQRRWPRCNRLTEQTRTPPGQADGSSTRKMEMTTLIQPLTKIVVSVPLPHDTDMTWSCPWGTAERAVRVSHPGVFERH